MKKQFEIIDHTADIGLRAFGSDLSQAFTNAARGMFSLITNIDTVYETVSRHVEVTASDREALLVEWLNELIYLFDSEQLLFSRFDIETLTATELKAHCFGEKANKSRHELKRGIKSATFHMVKIEARADSEYRVQVIFDI
jgi:SHS2 domain-containing protein